MMAKPARSFWIAPLFAAAALLMFVEEVLWEGAKRLTAAIGQIRQIRMLEDWISRRSPAASAALILLPGTVLLPVKMTALWLMAHGHAVLGFQVIVAAKLAGTALVARIFVLTKPQLMSLAWFAAIYLSISKWRNILYTWVQATATWQSLQAWRMRLLGWLARFARYWKPGRLGRRIRAVQRRQRRATFR